MEKTRRESVPRLSLLRRHHGDGPSAVSRPEALGAVSLSVMVGAPPAMASVARMATATRPTTTTLTVTLLDAGISDGTARGTAEWKASVTRPGGGLARSPGRTGTFVLSDGSHVSAAFSTGTAHPDKCSFPEVLTGTGETIAPGVLARCGGAAGGFVAITAADVQSPSTTVRARYLRAPGWASSCSAPINPERVAPSYPARSGAGPSA